MRRSEVFPPKQASRDEFEPAALPYLTELYQTAAGLAAQDPWMAFGNKEEESY